jgi:hypothetical protein
MAVSLFKKAPARHEGVLPARDALQAHTGALAAEQSKRAALAEKDAAARADIEQAEALALEVSQLRAAIDSATADARYSDAPAPDMAERQAALAASEQRLGKLETTARAAAIVRKRYESDLQLHTDAIKTLTLSTPRLLFNALHEIQQQRRARYEAAKIEMTAALHDALAPGAAIDELAQRHGWPPTGAGGLYQALQIPEVYPEPFDHTDITSQLAHGRALEAAHEAHRQAWLGIQAAGQQLAERLLSGKDG